MNHPRFPRWIIEGVNAKSRAANMPAVVPPNVRTRAKTIIVVSEPRITGRIIVKSSKDIPLPKIR